MLQVKKISTHEQGGVVHAFISSTQGGRGRLISVTSRPAWTTGQSEVHRETLSRKTKIRTKRKQNKQNKTKQKNPTQIKINTHQN